MCGIIGIVGKEEVADRLVDGLRRMEYRGYDSAGVCTVHDGQLVRRRAEGKLINLVKELITDPAPGLTGIAHTRWATHGAPTAANAHPHATGELALVHNGIIENFRSLREGLEGRGRTAVLVAVDGKACGIVAVADTIKAESVAAIRGMHELGLHVVMITGDNERAARAVADEVGIDEVQAGVLPEGKVDAIRELQKKYGNHVAMVGDGINDAPALKQANVGIAIGAGADVAIEAADVTLVRGELTGVVEAMHLSRATFSKIVQNLIWASAYNVAAIPIAAIGLLHPMIGVIAMTASSLSVIGNSLLLKRVKLSVASKA